MVFWSYLLAAWRTEGRGTGECGRLASGSSASWFGSGRLARSWFRSAGRVRAFVAGPLPKQVAGLHGTEAAVGGLVLSSDHVIWNPWSTRTCRRYLRRVVRLGLVTASVRRR
jgi:hypothetical protein